MNSHYQEHDEIISLSIAAQLSGFSAAHLRRLVETGEVWGVKIGNSWGTTEAAIAEYKKLNKKPGPKPKKG